MKKTLLVFSFLITIQLQAQDYWTQFATGQPDANTGVRSISIVDYNLTWLNMRCGTTNCTPIRRYAKTINGGMTWETNTMDLGVESANLEVVNISGTDYSTAYAAAHRNNGTTLGGIWKTADGGTTWTRQSAFSDPTSYTNLVHFWDANNGVALGDAVGGYFEIYTTTNGGSLWTRVASSPALIPLAEDEYLVDNNFTVIGNTILAMTSFGRLLKSTDKGLSWTISQTPLTDGFFNPDFGSASSDMAFTDDNNGLLQTNDFQLFYTGDGGASWSTMESSGTLRNFGISAMPGVSNTYIAIGEDTNAERGSSFSVDGGLTWTSINNNPDLDYVNGNVIEMLSSNHGFAGGFSISPVVGGIYVWNVSCNCAVGSYCSKNGSLQAFPNPVSGVLNIIGKNITRILISDFSGKQIFSKDYTAIDRISENLEALDDGIYLVRIFTGETSSVIRVIKQ